MMTNWLKRIEEQQGIFAFAIVLAVFNAIFVIIPLNVILFAFGLMPLMLTIHAIYDISFVISMTYLISHAAYVIYRQYRIDNGI
jgi:hypothetical protein